MSLSNYAENEVADYLAGNGAPAAISGVWVKLHTGDPGEDGTANASAETTRKSVTFGAASGGVCTSSSEARWDGWSAGSENITHVSYWDASTAGNPIGSDTNDGNQAVVNGNNFVLPSGSLTLGID